MTIKKLGLALSGGGVRAAAFHLGVLEKLYELNVLGKVSVLSTVSGGSIVGAYFMINKESFPEFKEKTIANLQKGIEWRWILGMLNPLNILKNRTEIVADIYDKIYFQKKTFASFPPQPKIVINATSLTTGKNFKFTQGNMGDWKIGYRGQVNTLKISNAVAASAAVPGWFAPLSLKTKTYFHDPEINVEKIQLCDGGVYDNQGTHALTSDYQNNDLCDGIICSDAAFPFDLASGMVTEFLPCVLLRQNNIMMERIKNMQFVDLVYGKNSYDQINGKVNSQKIRTSFFSINWTIDNLIWKYYVKEILRKSEKEVKYSINFKSDEFNAIRSQVRITLNYPEFGDYLSNERVERISRIGTRLRALSEEEINMLMLHGRTLCGFQVRMYLPELLV